MTTDRDELERLAKAATPGPWDVKTQEQWVRGFDFFDGPENAFTFPVDLEPEDAAFIAAANPAAILSLLTQLDEAEAALPTVDEAMAYAKGYEEGLRDAKEQNVATLIIERDTASANLAFEKVLRQSAEQSRDELRARLATIPTLPKEGASHD